MRKSYLKIICLLGIGSLLASGCATTRPRSAGVNEDLSMQVSDLQQQIAFKDQQIVELQHELQSYESALQAQAAAAAAAAAPEPVQAPAKKTSIIRVDGVSASDVQRALIQAGLDPGPVDGKMGNKTIAAIKEFQRMNQLTVDGIVGKKTWTYLHMK